MLDPVCENNAQEVYEKQGVLFGEQPKAPLDVSKVIKIEKLIKSDNSSFFKLCDLIAGRRRMDSWVLYQKFLRSGAVTEEIFWKVLWQIKTLLAVKKGAIQSLHPFVLNKNKTYSRLFEEEELVNFLGELTDILRFSRYGQKDLSIGLENFILKI
ncbi:MAG: hypothetical protein Q7R75_00030 [bacterium]|nr:hypothetical protein [bacterium]